MNRELIGKVAVPLVFAGLVIAAVASLRDGVTNGTTRGEWTCSMHPQIRLPQPGDCPICGMQLITVSELSDAHQHLKERAGLVTEVIRRRELFKEIRTTGKIDYSERQIALLSARVPGRVDRVFADFTGVEVKRGDHLVQIYSPDLYVAQKELLIALKPAEERRSNTREPEEFAGLGPESVRVKLRLLGILDEQIREIETTRRATKYLTIFAPIGGTVIEKNIREGQYVNTGDALYRIASFDPIWLYLNIYEYDIAWVQYGQKVDVAIEAFPGESLAGSVMFIDPSVDDATRSVRVRVNIANPDRRLKPQMYATATIHIGLEADGTPAPTGMEGMFVCPMHLEIIQRDPGDCKICEMPLERVAERRASQSVRPAVEASPENGSDAGPLAVPVSAVLDTGRRQIAYRLCKNGTYELVELKLGPRAHAPDASGKRREFFVVLDGVEAGDRVVSQSGFLLDSQRQIEGMPSLLYPRGQAGTSPHARHGAPPTSNDDSHPEISPHKAHSH